MAMLLMASSGVQAGRIITDSIESRVLGESVKYNVYVPNGFDKEKEAHYPVVYLLHGFTDDYTAWRDKSQMQTMANDDFLFDLNVGLHQLVRQKRVKSELRVRNGQHNWEYWHTALRMALPFASRNFY
ncbi:MAG: hypothetical protein IJV45_09485 [Prevotella sp.]|nr:hypothetical protein [Prevotella sp.]